MPEYQFFIQGNPAPGGSKRVFPMWDRKTGKLRTKTTATGREMPLLNVSDDAGKANKVWKEGVAMQARSFMRGTRPFEGPMKIEFVFFLRRPMFHFFTGRRSGELRPDAPKYHIVKPDALKLARSTEDALTGVVYVDDARSFRICSEKRYCGPTDKPGCVVRFIPLSVAS